MKDQIAFIQQFRKEQVITICLSHLQPMSTLIKTLTTFLKKTYPGTRSWPKENLIYVNTEQVTYLKQEHQPEHELTLKWLEQCNKNLIKRITKMEKQLNRLNSAKKEI